MEVVGPEGTRGLHGSDPLRRWKQGLVMMMIVLYLRYGDCAHAIKALRTQPHPAQQQYIMILLQLVAVVQNQNDGDGNIIKNRSYF